jgi:transcriptional regulator with XRE-family HTH domain
MSIFDPTQTRYRVTARLIKGIPRGQRSRLAREVGFHQQQLDRILHGTTFGAVKRERILKLAALLNVPAEKALKEQVR